MVLQDGEVIGPYQITRTLGQGGMAMVYEAHHAKLDRRVAIKVMHQGFLEDPNFLARFEREARIVARLEHGNIIPIYDYSEYKGQPYLVMKQVEGQTLKRHVLKKGVALDEIDAIMRPLADALDYAHEKGVLHRDIKPSNVMIDTRGTPYLTDFGLARITQSGESTMSADMMLGTPHYISPEQARGDKDLDSRTDLYSLAVILYELAVGSVPFSADTPYAIVHKHIYTDPPRPSEVNPELPPTVDAVLMKALAKKPADRYPTATAMIDAFQAALEGKETQPEAAVSSGPAAPKAIAPAPPPPPIAPRRKPVDDKTPSTESQKRQQVELNVDLGELDFSEIGRRMEEGIRRGTEYISNMAAEWEEREEEKKSGRRSKKRRRRDRRKNKPPWEWDKDSDEDDDRAVHGAITEEERIRLHVEKRLKKRQELISHVFTYLGVIALLVVIMGWSFVPMIVAISWGIGVFSHWMDYNSKYGSGADRREELIQREIERSRAYKLKNDELQVDDEAEGDFADVIQGGTVGRGVRLNDEGELTDSFVEEMDDYDQQQGYR